MHNWMKWCINHRLKWVVLTTLILSIPVYLAVGAYVGCTKLMREWIADWRYIKRTQAKEIKT